MREKTFVQKILEKRINELIKDKICDDATPMDFLTVLSKRYMMDYTDDFKHYRIHAERCLDAVSEALRNMRNDGILEERLDGSDHYYKLLRKIH
jgi:hypothetical protein